MAASDLLIHPSLTEASSNVTKEMGLLNKIVAVCKDVGDFNEYIKDGENSFFLDRNDLKHSLRDAIQHAYDRRHTLDEMGKKLNEQILTLFSDTTENQQRFVKLL
jgi:glycosyltransferase involved in cell wall biosynthesis